MFVCLCVAGCNRWIKECKREDLREAAKETNWEQKRNQS
jgi:hypothetical protein